MARLAKVVGWTLFYLLAAESVMQGAWRRDVIGTLAFTSTSPDYDYGFDGSARTCTPRGREFVCLPTQYRLLASTAFPIEKGDRTLRFITIGGSHAAGSDAYTRYASAALQEICAGVQWEGVNLGARGHGSTRIRVIAEEVVDYEPDILVLDFGGTNEFEDERDRFQRDETNKGIWRLVYWSRLVVVGRKLVARQTRRHAVMRSDSENRWNESEASMNPENLERWHRSLADNYRAIIHAAKANRIPVVVVGRAFLPPRTEVPGAWDRQRLFERLGDMDGVSALDVDPLFERKSQELGGREELFTEDRTHYTAVSREMIGLALAQLLLSLPGIRHACDSATSHTL